jgi:hypothetical protein
MTASTPLLAADYTEQPMLMPVASKAATIDTKRTLFSIFRWFHLLLFHFLWYSYERR